MLPRPNEPPQPTWTVPPSVRPGFSSPNYGAPPAAHYPGDPPADETARTYALPPPPSSGGDIPRPANTPAAPEEQPPMQEGPSTANVTTPPTQPSVESSAEPEDKPPARPAKKIEPPYVERQKLIIDKAIAENQKIQKDEQDAIAAKPGATTWKVRESSLEGDRNSFDSWFKGLTPTDEHGRNKGLKADIEDTLAPNTDRIGLELGGTGGELFKGFSPQFFHRTGGLALTDTRPMLDSKEVIEQHDRDAAHTFIPGDINTPEARQAVANWLNGEKADFIMERMFGGINGLAREPLFLGRLANFAYTNLKPNGLLFAQVPWILDPYMQQWLEIIDQQPAIDVTFSTTSANVASRFKLLRLHKQEGAPEQLPLVPAIDVMRRQYSLRSTRFGYKK